VIYANVALEGTAFCWAFLWPIGLSANVIKLHAVCGNKCFTRPAIRGGPKNCTVCQISTGTDGQSEASIMCTLTRGNQKVLQLTAIESIFNKKNFVPLFFEPFYVCVKKKIFNFTVSYSMACIRTMAPAGNV